MIDIHQEIRNKMKQEQKKNFKQPNGNIRHEDKAVKIKNIVDQGSNRQIL